jgi:hypothetical protein
MKAPSLRLELLVATRPDSEPARSMRLSVDIVRSRRVPTVQDSMEIRQRTWEREEPWL